MNNAVVDKIVDYAISALVDAYDSASASVGDDSAIIDASVPLSGENIRIQFTVQACGFTRLAQ